LLVVDGLSAAKPIKGLRGMMGIASLNPSYAAVTALAVVITRESG
jgi:hypothetical protein